MSGGGRSVRRRGYIQESHIRDRVRQAENLAQIERERVKEEHERFIQKELSKAQMDHSLSVMFKNTLFNVKKEDRSEKREEYGEVSIKGLREIKAKEEKHRSVRDYKIKPKTKVELLQDLCDEHGVSFKETRKGLRAILEEDGDGQQESSEESEVYNIEI